MYFSRLTCEDITGTRSDSGLEELDGREKGREEGGRGRERERERERERDHAW